jgi:Spy/CpxP family protein refolding chaperone
MRKALAVFLAVSLTPAFAFAADPTTTESPAVQGQQGKAPELRDGDDGEKRRARLFEKLQLDQETRTKLTQGLDELNQKAEPLRKQRYEAVATIKAQAQGKTDSATLKQTLERYYAATDALTTLKQQRRELFRQTLTPEQQEKLIKMRLVHRHHDKQHQREGSQKQG